MKRKSVSIINIWPGFVDVIATLLLVFVFLLAVLMISENFLTQAISGKNTALDNLRSKMYSLKLDLDEKTKKNSTLTDSLTKLNEQLTRLNIEKENLDANLNKEKSISTNLQIDIEGLEKKVTALYDELGIERLKVVDNNKIKKKLNLTIQELNESITTLNNKMSEVKKSLNISNKELTNKNIEITNLGNKLNLALEKKVGELEEYRSEFFGELKKIIGKEKEINIVGDRFVLQSEVFFKSGSAEIGKDGIKKVIEITKILKSITSKIPVNLNWLIQVEGHTDNLPIANEIFPSNWELSTARAISVAKIMMKNGISSDKINVAGYGEFRPLVANSNSKNREKNRRIELKLTQP